MAECKECLHYDICEIMHEQYGISKVYPSQCGYYKPAADVVPRAEVEKIFEEIDRYLIPKQPPFVEMDYIKFLEVKQKYTEGEK